MHHPKKKHFVIKSHKSHQWLIGLMIIVLFIMGYGLYTKVTTVDSISEDNYRMLTVGLLFSLNIILMILIIIVATFYIEIKDKFIED